MRNPLVHASRQLVPCLALAALFGAALPQSAFAANVVTKTAVLGTVSVPSSISYSNFFTLPVAGFNASTDTFYDDYLFTVPTASFSNLTATIDLGQVFSISNLQVRLYSGSTPTFGSPVGVGGTMLQAWQAPVGSGATALVINPQQLGAGSYILEVRGNITGAVGGSYIGTMNFADVSAVPDSNGLALAAAGLTSLLWMRARKKTK